MIKMKSDSREIKPGDTFIALRGITSDGHDYILKAIEQGATRIIAEEGSYSVETKLVPNTRTYLEQYLLKTYGEILNELNIIGVTGTNGKTTICYLLYQALNLSGSKTAYIGTLGYFIEKKERSLFNTTPDILEIYNMIVTAYNRGCKNIIIEISSEGIAHRRVEGIKYDWAIFSNLTQDHLNYHKTMENYALAKQRIFKSLKSKHRAIINTDDQYVNYFLLKENNNITYGYNNADYQIIDFIFNNTGMEITYKYENETRTFKTSLLGSYNVYNLISVVAVLKESGLTYEKIEEIIPKLLPPSGRMERISYKINNIIIDFAHSPDSLIKFLEVIKDMVKGKIYVVFGCAGERDKTKRPIMFDIVTRECDFVIITNEDPRSEDPNDIAADMIKGSTKTNYEVIHDRKRAIIKGIELLDKDDTLLILGKGHEETITIGKEIIPYNDRQVVMEYLESQK